MRGIELPGGVRLEEPDPAAALIVQALAPLLTTIVNQIELLIALEVGAADREEWKGKILAAKRDAEARAAASGNGHTE